MGNRPRALKDLRYEWAYLFSAVCAERGVGAAPVLPYANANAMMLHLAEVSRQVAPGAHAVLVCDGAGWHKSGGRLRVPENISLLQLPPYSPELNPVENIWECLHANKLSNSVFDTFDTIVGRCCTAWDWIMDAPDRIRSLATTPWIKTVEAWGVSFEIRGLALPRFGSSAFPQRGTGHIRVRACDPCAKPKCP